MPVPVQCEQCDAKYLIEDKFAGKRAKCKRCGHIMSIPLAGAGAGIALAADDTDGSGTPSVEPGPWGGPPLSTLPGGVTSQPPRGWRPQDIVIEREDDITEIPLSLPYHQPLARKRRETTGGIDKLVPLLLLLFFAGLAYLGVVGQIKINTLSTEQVSGAGYNPSVRLWSTLALYAMFFFAIVGPLTLAGVAIASKIMNFGLPGSSYARACAVAAIPALIPITMIGAAENKIADPVLFVALILGGIGIAFVAVHFVYGIDWPSTIVSFLGAAGLGFVGFIGAALATSFIAVTMFKTPTTTITRSSISPSPSTSWPTPPRRTITPPSFPTPTVVPPAIVDVQPTPPTVVMPPPAVAPMVRPEMTPPSSIVRRNPPVVTSPPVRNVTPVLPGDGLDGPTRPDKPITGESSDDLLAKIRAAAGPMVASATMFPLPSDVVTIIRPATPSNAFALVRSGDHEETVEVYAGQPPKKVGEQKYKVETFSKPNYGLSADGQRLLHVATFPKLSVHAVAVADGHDVGEVELDSDLGTPVLLGFLNNDRFLIRWEKFAKYGLEVWDFKSPKRFARRVDLPEHDASPANEAISADGRLFATASRVRGKGPAAKSQSQLALHSLVDGTVRRLPINELDERWSIAPAGLSFTSDGSKVAALFVHDGNALIIGRAVKTGQPLPKVQIGGTVAPLERFGESAAAGVRSMMAPAPSLDPLAGGAAWLVCGSSVVDMTGRLIADLAASEVFDQAVVGEGVVHLAFKNRRQPVGMAIVTLDSKKLPATRPAVAPVAPTTKPIPPIRR